MILIGTISVPLLSHAKYICAKAQVDYKLIIAIKSFDCCEKFITFYKILTIQFNFLLKVYYEYLYHSLICMLSFIL